jgi:hypothetical protein
LQKLSVVSADFDGLKSGTGFQVEVNLGSLPRQHLQPGFYLGFKVLFSDAELVMARLQQRKNKVTIGVGDNFAVFACLGVSKSDGRALNACFRGIVDDAGDLRGLCGREGGPQGESQRPGDIFPT